MRVHHTQLFSTYSIVAHDADTGQLGVAVQTHQMCVGDIVPWLLPGVGAVATQSLVNISFGPIALTMLKEGITTPNIILGLVASDPEAHRRQVAVVDATGQTSTWTGDGCIAEASHQTSAGYSVQANMMTNATIVPAMAAAYESATGDLAQRMLAALVAAQAEDGDIRGMQSAALKVVPGDINQPAWSTDYDLRVDEHANPIEELTRLVRLRHAQLSDQRGYALLQQGQREQALTLWANARREAPQLEELPFWQAVTLADKHADIPTATEILRPALTGEPRRAHWIDLIRRLQDCALITRAGAAEDLIKALEE